jgi:uncharacterized protein YciI
MIETQEFVIMFKPPRTNFNETSTKEEQRVIGEHFSYLKDLIRDGILKHAGRCDDATFGLVILETESLETAAQIMENDPAIKAGIFIGQIWRYHTALER